MFVDGASCQTGTVRIEIDFPVRAFQFVLLFASSMSTHPSSLGKRGSASRGRESSAIAVSAAKRPRVASSVDALERSSDEASASLALASTPTQVEPLFGEVPGLPSDEGHEKDDGQEARDGTHPVDCRSTSAAAGFSSAFSAALDLEVADNETAGSEARLDTVMGSATSRSEHPTTVVASTIATAQAPVRPVFHAFMCYGGTKSFVQ